MSADAPAPSSAEEVPFGEVLGPSSDGRTYRYVYVQYLGRGGYGLTYVVKRQEDGARLVVKILSLGTQAGTGSVSANPGPSTNNALQSLEQSSLAKVTSEVNNLTRISKHFGVTQLEEGIIVDRHALLFMEFCDAGDLHREIYRMRRRGTAFAEDTVKIVLLQLVFALHHLHRTGMMHRDVKASNVLLCTTGLVKLGDFGLSKTVEVASTFCGTPTHLAPEVWERNTYGKKADVWSLGVVLYHILALKVPFTSRQYDQLRRQVAREEYPRLSEMRLRYSTELISLCERLMTRSPELRPDTSAILREPLILAMIDRWPELIRNSPTVKPVLRDRIMQCLVDDCVLAANADGSFSCATNLRETAPATEDGPFAVAENAEQPAEEEAPASPAPPPTATAEEGEAFVISPDTVQVSARRADTAVDRDKGAPVDDNAPMASQALADAAGATPPAVDNGSAVLRKGLAWKARITRMPDGTSSVKWIPRGFVLTPLMLVLYSVDESAAALLVHDGIDSVASAPIDAASVPSPQRLQLSQIENIAGCEPVSALYSDIGLPDEPENSTATATLYPIRLYRRDGKQFDIGVIGEEVHRHWMLALSRSWQNDSMRRHARDQSAATSNNLSVVPVI
jgi:serine/threonine protein kinase